MAQTLITDKNLATSGTMPAWDGSALTNLPAGGDKRNYIIDGDLTQWPEGTAQVSNPSTGNYFPAMWKLGEAAFANTTLLWDYETSVLPTVAESNHKSEQCLKISTSGSAETVETGDKYALEYDVTGFDYASLHGQQVTLAFWVRSSKTGTYSISLANSAKNRSRAIDYTISSANTWERKTITTTLDDSGTWLFDENVGLRIRFCLFAGSSLHGTDSWQAGNILSTSNQVNWADTSSATFYLSQVGLYLGSSAPDSFVAEPISAVKDQVDYYVQRYNYDSASHEAVGVGAIGVVNTATQLIFGYRKEIRSAPTVTASDKATFNILDNSGSVTATAGTLSAINVGKNHFRANLAHSAFRTANDAVFVNRNGTNTCWIMLDARH